MKAKALFVSFGEELFNDSQLQSLIPPSPLRQAAASTDIADLAGLVKACLLADLPQAAETCIACLQAAAWPPWAGLPGCRFPR